MQLSAKALLLVTEVVLILILILYGGSSNIILVGINQIEQQAAEQNIQRVQDALALNLAALTNAVSGWAMREETSPISPGASLATISFEDTTLAELRLSLVLLVNPSGQVVYARAFDLKEEKALPLPQNLERDLSTGDILRTSSERQRTMAGIVLFQESPLLIAAAPVQSDGGRGPILGMLIFGRLLDDSLIEQLSLSTHLPVSVNQFNNPQMPNDFQTAVASLSESAPIFVQPLNNQEMAGYTLLNDIYGKPALVLRADTPRAIYAQSTQNIRNFLLVLVVVLASMGVGAQLLVRRVVHDWAARQESEGRLHAVTQSAVDGIVSTDNDGRILSWNKGAQRIFSYTEKEISSQPMTRLLAERDRAAYQNAMAKVRSMAQSDARANVFEFTGLRKGSSEFPAEISLAVWQTTRGRFFSIILRDITERKHVQEQLKQQVDRLNSLRAIDLTITASTDLRPMLRVVLEEVRVQLHVDAAAVLLLNLRTHALEYVAGQGFRTNAIGRSCPRLGEGYAGRAALERQVVSLPDISELGTQFEHFPELAGEDFRAFYFVPLISKGQVKGVLEIFHRAPLHPSIDWTEFLDSLAGQAAIAIDNAELFEGLQRSNIELALAYDSTLEGWSRALDLRDRETEGHTQRVTKMTLHLARVFGMSSEEQVHVFRGALLHDIGKMGVPDSILLKAGPLTYEEAEIMRRHPVYAYELLSPINYLRPAIEIPYCHHEKWDGTGYPRGLKDEQIPLAARIFAIVDVWDALRSDRPYRLAWPMEKVREHIRAGSGTHFDPKAVEVFLNALSERERNGKL